MFSAYRFAPLILTALVLLTACAPIQPVSTTPEPPAAATPPATEEPAMPEPSLWPAIAEQARDFLAAELALPAAEIRILDVEEVEWPDGCLGIREPDIFCVQVITPGYRVLLGVGDVTYALHTNRSGSDIRIAPDGATRGPMRFPATAPADTAELPPPLTLRLLAAAIEQTPDELVVREVESVEWPDACLGVYHPDEMCATVIVPGYRIVVQVGDASYVLHTDARGENVRVAEQPEERN